ncbi:hypothetical protein psyc5s11_26510 [Clostridium gelidum]|uniref:DUF1189 domain-containing protein n=1 Tax=Clostridium gelidum TaxID=704125 RepID=A0ABN6IWR6_9CLOT|nr:DUF1189 domain-containing protein [Clostridium gelidum]BCZ46584.1 hypothetical protein psyc5s11_26510 [Clostridium gelidum]
METKMGFRHKFAYSFFDFAAYKEFLVQGLGKSILYMFLVTLIFSTISNINIIDKFNSELSNVETTFIHSAPNFELKNGTLSVGSDEPIYYKYDDQQLIVDTSGKTNKSILDSYSDGIYINSDELIMRQKYTTLQTLKFSNFPELNITKISIQDSMSALKIIFPVLLLFLNPIIAFLLNLISGFLIIGPLSLSISGVMGVKFKCSELCILSFYAMTLPLLLESLISISGIDVPEFYVIFYVLSLVYCGLAINKIKNIDKSNLNLSK